MIHSPTSPAPTNVTTDQTDDDGAADPAAAVWRHPPAVVAAATAALLAVSVAGAALNALLVLTVHSSPSLRTPPNSQLLNICLNGLLLALHALLALPALHLDRGLQGGHDTGGAGGAGGAGGTALSGLQLFLAMHCLLQVSRQSPV